MTKRSKFLGPSRRIIRNLPGSRIDRVRKQDWMNRQFSIEPSGTIRTGYRPDSHLRSQTFYILEFAELRPGIEERR